MQYYQSMRDLLIKLPRNIKRSIMIFGDLSVIFFVFWLALMIRAGEVFSFNETYILTNAQPEDLLLAYSILVIVTIPVFVYSRLYRSIIRYISLETYVKIIKATATSSLLASSVIYYLSLPLPRSAFLIYFILLTGFMLFTRFVARSYLLDQRFRNQKNILIYGVNDSSQKVSEILKNTKDFNISGFISKDARLKRTYQYLWQMISGG